MRRFALLFALTACDGAQLVLDEPPGEPDPVDVPDPVFESDPPEETDADVDDTEPPGDTDPGETQPPEEPEQPQPTNPLSWTGRVEASYKPIGYSNPCSIVVRESGDEVLGDAKAACSNCDHVFRVKNSVSGFCPGLPVPLGDTWRGVRWGSGNQVEIYTLERGLFGRWEVRRLANGQKGQNGVITYTYNEQVFFETVPYKGNVSIK